MSEVILKFDSIEESEDLRNAIDGFKWKGVAWDLDQYLRNKIKYSDDSVSDDVLEALEKVSEELKDLINSYKLYLD